MKKLLGEEHLLTLLRGPHCSVDLQGEKGCRNQSTPPPVKEVWGVPQTQHAWGYKKTGTNPALNLSSSCYPFSNSFSHVCDSVSVFNFVAIYRTGTYNNFFFYPITLFSISALKPIKVCILLSHHSLYFCPSINIYLSTTPCLHSSCLV